MWSPVSKESKLSYVGYSHIHYWINLFFSASLYEVRYSEEFGKLKSNFGSQPQVTSSMVVGGSTNLTSPREAGQQESIVVAVDLVGECVCRNYNELV